MSKFKLTCVDKETLLNQVEKMKNDGYTITKDIWWHFSLRYFKKMYSVELFLSYKNLDAFLLKHGITSEIIDEAMKECLSSKEVIERYYKK